MVNIPHTFRDITVEMIYTISSQTRETAMKRYIIAYLAGVRNKYILAWLLGVPVTVLIIVYFISNFLR